MTELNAYYPYFFIRGMGGSMGMILGLLVMLTLVPLSFGFVFAESEVSGYDEQLHPNFIFTTMDEGQVADTLDIGASPIEISVNPTTNKIYVTNRDNSISVIDGSNNSIVDTIEIGASPRGVAVNPTTNIIYVTNSLDNSVSIIDGANNSIVGTIDVGNFPRGVVVNPTTNTIYVAHPLEDSISVIDGFNNTIVGVINVESGSFGISVNPSTNKIYAVSCFYDDNSISVIDGSNNLVVDTIDAEKCALAIAINPISNTIYMPNSDDNTISIIADRYTLPKVETEPFPISVSPTKKAVPIQTSESVGGGPDNGYNMAENVEANFTFTFRDGVEFYKFPVFKMTSDFVANAGTTFAIEGTIGDSPYLHKALDEAFKYRVMTSTGSSSFEYDYRFFDVDVELTRDNQTMRTLHYYNCEVLDYQSQSLNSNDYESYASLSTGFAVVDQVEFRCGGINAKSPDTATLQNIDYGEIYNFSENVRTFITFEFDEGVEKIEFPSFELTSGFEESSDAVSPGFSVQGVVNYYPLLYKAIDNSRKVSGIGSAYNTDFEANVEFSNGEKTLRSLDFRDCRVSGAIINTESDKEEGYTGKSGFALVNEIDFSCAGLKPADGNYKKLRGDAPIWEPVFLTNEQLNSSLRMADEVRVVATFTFGDGVETLEFPIFRQGDVLSKANPTFELEGIVGDYPLLYKKTDENLKVQSVSGANLMTELFDVDVNLFNNESIRGFSYSNCRVVDYVVASDMNAEENYIKGVFALENTFDFECQGFHPNNPLFDSKYGKHQKAKTKSTFDLRDTHDWEDGFYVK